MEDAVRRLEFHALFWWHSFLRLHLLGVMFIFIRWFICDLLAHERHIWRARPFSDLQSM